MEVNQVLPNMEYADAISTYALLLRRIIRGWGAKSHIYAQYIHPDLRREARQLRFLPRRLPADAITIYHYSIGSEATRIVSGLPGRKALVYHNITPPDFSLAMGGPLSWRFHAGIEELKSFTQTPDIAVGVSEYNRQALVRFGFPRTGVLPMAIDIERFDRPADPELARRLSDGAVNFITVGRIYPHKRIDDVILAFIHYKRYVNDRSRLFIVGDCRGMEDYHARLQTMVLSSEVDGIVFTGRVRFSELLAYYRSAHVFLCMSEHEGFCVPLLEAMYLGVPIVAYKAAAIGETLGGAGILVNHKDFARIAEMADLLVRDKELRARVIQRQKERAQIFHPDALAERLRRILGLDSGTVPR